MDNPSNFIFHDGKKSNLFCFCRFLFGSGSLRATPLATRKSREDFCPQGNGAEIKHSLYNRAILDFCADQT